MTRTIAEVLAIGDELTHGYGIDTNSAFIARQLESLGVHVGRFTVVSDDPADLDAALREACARTDVLIATGGLGPTADDRTREAAAAAAGVELRFDEPSWRQIESWFRSKRRKIADSNRRQAYLPATATALENRWGTAPGFRVDIGRARFYALPGVPREMRKMLDAHVLPDVRQRAGLDAIRFHTMRVLGPSEAVLGERLGDRMAPGREPRVGVTAHYGLLSVRIAATAGDVDAAQRVLEATASELRPLLGPELVCEGDDELVRVVGRELLDGEVTFATAESCTGGLLAAQLTDIPGISRVFLGGFVTYSDVRKRDDLGVPAALLAEHGAVSEEVAAAMAKGCAGRAGARLGVGISGIAGPGGGSDDKPVGTVCFGLHFDGETRGWRVAIPPLGRVFIRERSVLEILAAIHRAVRKPGPAPS